MQPKYVNKKCPCDIITSSILVVFNVQTRKLNNTLLNAAFLGHNPSFIQRWNIFSLPTSFLDESSDMAVTCQRSAITVCITHKPLLHRYRLLSAWPNIKLHLVYRLQIPPCKARRLQRLPRKAFAEGVEVFHSFHTWPREVSHKHRLRTHRNKSGSSLLHRHTRKVVKTSVGWGMDTLQPVSLKQVHYPGKPGRDR